MAPAENRNQLTPSEIGKQEFGRRLHDLILQRGWNQSEFAREVERITGEKIGRDSVSTYVNGRTYPTPKMLKMICDTLGVTREELLPNSVISAMEAETPSMQLTQVSGHPDKVMLRINRLVPIEIGAEVIRMIAKADTTKSDEI